MPPSPVRVYGGAVHYKPPAELTNPDYTDRGGSLHGGFMAHHVTCVYELITVEPGTGGFVSAHSHLPAERVLLNAWFRTPLTNTVSWSVGLLSGDTQT